MLNCHELSFSKTFSKKRIALANKIMGVNFVKKIIALALYLLGASRKSIADQLNISYDTFKSFTQRLEKEGVSTLIDRRFKTATLPDYKPQISKKVKADYEEDFLIIDLGMDNKIMKIPVNNTLQIKTVLLTMFDNKLLDSHKVAQLLDYSQFYIRQLNQKLQKNDVEIFIDKRQGQQQDYVFNQQNKIELMQQFIANLVSGCPTSSQQLSEDLKARCMLDLASRTIRFHIEKFGLSKIKKSLPKLIEDLKKTSKNNI